MLLTIKSRSLYPSARLLLVCNNNPVGSAISNNICGVFSVISVKVRGEQWWACLSSNWDIRPTVAETKIFVFYANACACVGVDLEVDCE